MKIIRSEQQMSNCLEVEHLTMLGKKWVYLDVPGSYQMVRINGL